MVRITVTIDDVVRLDTVNLAIIDCAANTDETCSGSGTLASAQALADGFLHYIDADDGRCISQLSADGAHDDDIKTDVGGCRYTISDWSDDSVVGLEVPTIDEALAQPTVVRKMAQAAKSTHYAESDLSAWAELIEELDEIEGAAATLKAYGDMYTGGCIADAAHEWIDAGIEDDGSIGSWCEIGCWDASTAAAWIAAGLTPDDVEAVAKAIQEEVSDDDMHARYSGGIIYACCNNDIAWQDVVKMHNKLLAK